MSREKSNYKITAIILVLITTVLSACQEQSQNTEPERITLQHLQRQTENMRKELPMRMGPGVVWRTSEAQPDLRIVHKYEFERLATVPELIRLLDKQQATIVRDSCSDSSVRFLLDGGVTIIYEYALQDGTLLTTNAVALKDCS